MYNQNSASQISTVRTQPQYEYVTVNNTREYDDYDDEHDGYEEYEVEEVVEPQRYQEREIIMVEPQP